MEARLEHSSSQSLPGPATLPTRTRESFLLRGSLESVTYFNAETGQCIFNFKPFGSADLLSVHGRAPYLYPGLTVEAEIREISKNQGGNQNLSAGKITLLQPSSPRDVRRFLKSSGFSGVGSHLAKVLSQAFPNNFFETLINKPLTLSRVPGVGKKRRDQILKAWEEFVFMTSFETYLFEHKLPLTWAKHLWGRYQLNAKDFFLAHPYQTVRKDDLDFDLVDAFVLKQEISQPAVERVRAALYFLLKTHYREGHCAHSEEGLISKTIEKLKVEMPEIEEGLELELLEENFVTEVIDHTACIYLKEVWETERNVAKHLLAFEKKSPPWGWMNFPRLLAWAQSLLDIRLAPLQVEAIEKSLSHALTVITGGPGTGKTTLIKSLVTMLKTQSALFALCSPTGRGAQRLEEATGAPAKTIHRLLKYSSLTGEFSHNKENPLNVDLVLIDEVSMVDLHLMSHLLDALPPHCALILVGDVDQIPPVGAGHILQSLIQSERFATVRLTEIFRQSSESQIKVNARRINDGEMPSLSSHGENDFHYLPVEGAEAIEKTVVELLTKTIPEKYGITEPQEMQVLLPLNRGHLGTLEFNHKLQYHLGLHSSPRTKRLLGFEQNLRVGDKVMITKNDYRKGVFNGDIGFIKDIDHFEQMVDVEIDDKWILFRFDELDRLSLAYAVSIHKSQGSEYRAVVVVIAEEHLPVAQRQLLYTAVTRGKEHVFLVAEPKALEKAIQSNEGGMRWQKLTELLSMDSDRPDKE